MKFEKVLTNLAIIYFLIGLVFAVAFSLYYHWTAGSFLSPGFYAVALTWPYQAIGFIGDLSYYGFAGKPI